MSVECISPAWSRNVLSYRAVSSHNTAQPLSAVGRTAHPVLSDPSLRAHLASVHPCKLVGQSGPTGAQLPTQGEPLKILPAPRRVNHPALSIFPSAKPYTLPTLFDLTPFPPNSYHPHWQPIDTPDEIHRVTHSLDLLSLTMVSPQQPTSGVIMAEIDPGPPMLTAHESAYSLGLSQPQMTEPNTTVKAGPPLRPSQRPDEQKLVSLFGDQATGVGRDGKFYQENKELGDRSNSTFAGLSCPFALASRETYHHRDLQRSWMDLREHLTTGHRRRQYAALCEGPHVDATMGQARGYAPPEMLPTAPRPLRPIGRLGGAIAAGRVEHVLPLTSRPVRLLRGSYDAVVIGSGYGGDLARTLRSRAGEDGFAATGGECESPSGHEQLTKQVSDDHKRSCGSALLELGDGLSGGHPTDEMDRVILGKEQHAGLRDG